MDDRMTCATRSSDGSRRRPRPPTSGPSDSTSGTRTRSRRPLGNLRRKGTTCLARFNSRGRSAPDCQSSPRGRLARSEEHTSELQSLAYLVCRLLLEKKKHTADKNGEHTDTK